MARILLTEDDDAVQAFVARALQMDGHTVITADDGEDGYDRIIEHDGEFDLLLSDIKMPFMDGIELAQTVAKHFPHMPILLMTGYADQRERADGVNAVVVDVINKPFSLAEIRSAVKRALAASVTEVQKERLLKLA
ncbi:MAG: response regulator [Pseudomonadota bacterium]